MSRIAGALRATSFASIALLVALIGVAIVVGPLVQIFQIGLRELIIFTLVAVTLLLTLIPTDRVLRFGFTLWILTFAFGWRTIYLTPILNIHPSEVLMWILLFAIVMRAVINRLPLDLELPFAIPFFMLFAVFGIFIAWSNGAASDNIVEEFKVFAAIPFAYYLVRWSIQSRQDWERAARWAIVVAVYISCLGLLDLFFPDASRALAGREDLTPTIISQSYQGAAFARVGFIFYGNFSAGFVIFTFTGFTIHYALNSLRSARIWQRVSWAFLLVAELAGIYLSGYRGLWYAAVVFLAVYAVLQRRALGLIAAGFVALPFLPIDFLNRFQSVFNTQFADSSQYDRAYRAMRAFDLFVRSPLTGWGWGGSGYVHSDFIQIAANLGIFGVAFFIFWMLGILWRLLRLARRQDWAGDYARLLFAMVCAFVVIFAGEGLIVFVQLVIPVWFLFAMCDRLVELADPSDARGNRALAIPPV